MENFKFILSSIIILVIFGYAGYWAFSTIETGSSHVDNQKQKELETKNDDLTKQVTELKKEISILQGTIDEQSQKDQVSEVVNIPEQTIPEAKTPTPTKVIVSKYQILINDLQKLVDGNIYLKFKSQGPAVGTLQKFLNIYNKTSNKVDNDYGTSTVTAIKSFQKAQGLVVDGESGPSTYKKMISWLKNHS